VGIFLFIVNWSKERERVYDVYSVVQLGPNPFWSELCACTARKFLKVNVTSTEAKLAAGSVTVELC
jgi:hypothetical protein